VNLFTPSQVKWAAGNGHYGLTQETAYPFDNKITIKVAGSTPAEFAINVRIPAWTSSPVLSVNGNRVSESVQPGTFAAIKRTWKDGDRIEFELSMPLKLEAVDANHPNLVALMNGPLVLFAIGDSQPTFEESGLLQAKATNNATGDWIAKSVDGSDITMRPFMNIDKESYSTYGILKS